jgi:hypothetical protein
MSRSHSSATYLSGMTQAPNEQDPPVDVEGMAGEEDLDAADVADRVDEDPEEQPNRVDPDYAQDEGDPV